MAFGIGEAVAAGLQVINKFIPDPNARIAAEAQLRQDLLAWDKSQTDVNAVEAASGNVFVSGWRPAIGWVCAVALAFNYLFPYVVYLIGPLVGPIPAPPKLDGSLMELVMALLGLAGLRSFDKLKGLTK